MEYSADAPTDIHDMSDFFNEDDDADAVLIEEGPTGQHGLAAVEQLNRSFKENGFGKDFRSKLGLILYQNDIPTSVIRHVLGNLIPGIRERLKLFQGSVFLNIYPEGDQTPYRFTIQAQEEGQGFNPPKEWIDFEAAKQIIRTSRDIDEIRDAIQSITKLYPQIGGNLFSIRTKLSNDLKSQMPEETHRANVHLHLNSENRIKSAEWELIYPEST